MPRICRSPVCICDDTNGTKQTTEAEQTDQTELNSVCIQSAVLVVGVREQEEQPVLSDISIDALFFDASGDFQHAFGVDHAQVASEEGSLTLPPQYNTQHATTNSC